MRGKYKFKVDFDAKQYIGIHLNWNYVDCTVRCSMREYAKQALEALKHMFTGKHYYAPSKIDRPDYRAKIQFAKINTAAPLSLVQIKHIERVVGRFLYYARAIDNTMLNALNDIASSKSKGTQTTWEAVKYSLNYTTSNPNAEISSVQVICYIQSTQIPPT